MQSKNQEKDKTLRAESNDMFYSEFKMRHKYFKETEKGVIEMSDAAMELVGLYSKGKIMDTKEEGRAEGKIKGFIEAYHEMGMSLDEIANKLTVKFQLTRGAAQQTVKAYLS